MRRPAFHCPNITLPRIFKRFKCRSERFPAGVSDNFKPGFQRPTPAVFRYPGRGGEDVPEYSSPVSGEDVTFSATPQSPAREDGRCSPDRRRSRDHLHPRRLLISPQPQRCQGRIAIAKPPKRHSSDTENHVTIAPQRLNVIAHLNLPQIRLSSSARRIGAARCLHRSRRRKEAARHPAGAALPRVFYILTLSLFRFHHFC